MEITGSHLFQASPELIWSKLLDPEILARITPGISRLEQTGENSYDAIAEVKIGPVSGSFKGQLEIQDKQYPSSFKLLIKQNSKIGNVSAEVHIDLLPLENSGCEVKFNGKAVLSGLLARTGQRVLTGVSSTLSKQFFAGLEREINQNS